MSKKDDELGSLSDVVAGIEKQHGAGSIMLLGSKKFAPMDVISTGSLALDSALCIGGLPRGRVVEIVGVESGGKTTLTLQIIAEAQKLGGKAAFIDAEHALDPVYARKLGVDVDNLLISQPDNGEQALEITESLIKSGKIAVVVVDSVAALVPKAELEGDMGDPTMGLQARLMSQALRKLTAVNNQTHTILIFINQIREKIGVFFGSNETTTGGRALKFYASVRLDVRKIETIKHGDVIVGAKTRIRCVKNKCGIPFREAEVELLYGEGISKEYDLLSLGETHKVLEKNGVWYAYKGERLGQGVEQARLFLVSHPEVSAKLDAELRSIIFKKG